VRISDSDFSLSDARWETVPIATPLPRAEAATKIKRAWTPVRVPGHWQLEDAFADYEGYVLYRTTFEAPPIADGACASLRFEGVYYAARVWLNGVYLGSHEGYFSAFEFDCTEYLVAGENELLVEVYSPQEAEENTRETIGGVWARWDGMDPDINPGGIFREVTLVWSGEVRVLDLGVNAELSGEGTITLDLYARRGGEVEISGSVDPIGFEAPSAEFRQTVRVEPGENHIETTFSLRQPRLWWTWDRGQQHLYELSINCAGTEERLRFGVKSVELRDWDVYLNGERVFMRGINYLPTDAYPARATEQRLRADAALVRDAYMNSVRVHAHIAGGAFYRACDELGVLVLQDFPLQWTHRRSVLEPAVAQAKEMARDLRNYPSVSVYLAHDEPFYVVPPEKWNTLALGRTVAEVLSPRFFLWQRRVLGPAVVGAIHGIDASRPVIEAAGHPFTTNHLYFGWYYGQFRDLERAVRIFPGLSRLPTEYGAQAMPDPASLQEIWPEGQAPDWQTLSENYRLQFGRMQRYVLWEGDRLAYVRDSQAYQAEVLKHATELFRRRKYRPTGGTFAFMLNDPAPAISWSVVDWRRRPKKAYGAIARAMRPVLVCAHYPNESYDEGAMFSVPLFVVNDLARELGPLEWAWELRIEGEKLARGSGTTVVPADSVMHLGKARASLAGAGHATLALKLSGDDVDETNDYSFAVTGGSGRGTSALARLRSGSRPISGTR
jgi:beta-mannosidase